MLTDIGFTMSLYIGTLAVEDKGGGRSMNVGGFNCDALLAFLFQHIETPTLCRFRWQENSIAFWDNRCAQHQALFDYWPHKRYGQRVTICGDRPFGQN